MVDFAFVECDRRTAVDQPALAGVDEEVLLQQQKEEGVRHLRHRGTGVVRLQGAEHEGAVL